VIVDLFAGPGGWDVGYRNWCLKNPSESLQDLVGVELDKSACLTRAAAGLLTIRGDVTSVMPEHSLSEPVQGLIASPPCQSFSQAGKRSGSSEMSKVLEALTCGTQHSFTDPRTELVLAPMRWIETLEPEWVAMEQVRPVLPIWEAYEVALQALGYSTWSGVLNAADFGVPQTRKRAFFLASRVADTKCPEPTHSKKPVLTMEGELLPWVTMAEALGWDENSVVNTRGNRTTIGGNEFDVDQPSWALTGRTRSWKVKASPAEVPDDKFKWVFSRPSTTIVGSFSPDVCAPPTYRKPGDGPRQNQPGAVTITLEEALVLQSFPPDYPLQGSRTAKFRQVGDAVPPTMGEVLLNQVL